MPSLLLASSSPYRKALLERLGLSFSCLSPDVDESPRAGEPPRALAARLSEQKAMACAGRSDADIIIASDQTAALDTELLGKPGNFDVARRQLQRCSGRSVTFFTGLVVYDRSADVLHRAVETTRVEFRQLDEQQIERYLQREQPWDCAGSFKVEGLGISLFQRIVSDDPNALVGLPLIRLVDFLGEAGVIIP